MTSRRWMLLHGTPLGPAVWAATAAALDDQAVLVPDCSVVPAEPDPQGVLARRLLEESDGELDVVGHSFGGQVALEVALRAPERVRSITVLCSRDTPVPTFGPMAAALRTGPGPTVEATLARWFSPAELQTGSAAVRTARTALRMASDEQWARALSGIATYDAAERTPSLSLPATLVAAGHDGVSDPESMRALAARLPDAEFTVEDDWYHMSPFVDPVALAERLLRIRR